MSLSNEDELEDEREGEEEIKRLRAAMALMSPEQRKLYEKFISSFWPKVVENLKSDKNV